MADDKVIVKVATKEDLSGVKAIEQSIEKIKREKIQLKIDAKTEQLKEADTKLSNLKKQLAEIEAVPPHLRVNVSEEGINKLKSDISSLEQKTTNLKLDIEKSELEQTKAEIQAIENDPINVELETQTAMMAIDQMSQGFDRLKQGASELKTQMSEVLEASGRMENTETFLSMNIGAEQAKKKMEEIRNVTDQLPGDDVTLQNLLSQSVIKDANMGADAMKNLGSAAADYMAGMQNFGKTSLETQQDLMNYILAGNTAEVERSPILQSHIDKLKEANTVQERSKALQEALQAEGWSGIAQQDTYNNKLQKFNDMLTRGQMNLGDMFREPTEDAMEFLIKLDEVSGGLVGMAAAGAQMVTPMFDSVLGLVQMASGLKNLGLGSGVLTSIKDKFIGLKDTVVNVASSIKSNMMSAFSTIRDTISNTIIPKFRELASTIKDNLVGALRTLKDNISGVASTIKDTLLTAFSSLKDTLTTSIIPAIQDAGRKFIELGRNALTAGLNALKSVAYWVAEKVALAATTTWSYITAGAQAFLNAVMSMNPIMLVVLALLALVAACVWAYQNIDWFRQMVDLAWQSITQLAGAIWGFFKGAFDMISNTVSGFTSKLGLEKDNWINSVLSFIIFIATLPVQLGVIFANAIAKALGFGDNFVQKMANAALDAVNGFINWISSLPGKLAEELNKMLDMVSEWAMKMADKMTLGGASMVSGWINGSGEHSPGFMYEALIGELSAMEKAPEQYDFSGGMKTAGASMVNAFNPNIGSSDSNGVVGTNNITINIESVDNEDRIQEIVEAVEEALKFDNVTAGRTV